MQSWGSRSKFNQRDTEMFPTYSGVIGLIACAMGISRDNKEALRELTSLKMSVRIDQPGILRSDWQVAHTQKVVINSKRKYDSLEHELVSELDKKATYTGKRQYLSDAKFVVALSGEDELVEKAAAAIKAPKWAIYLGRKSFVPDHPPYLDLVDSADVLNIFSEFPWMASESYMKRHQSNVIELWVDSRIEVDGEPIASYIRKDMPVSFACERREYLSHVMNEFLIPVGEENNINRPVQHDPIGFLIDFNETNK